MLTIKYHQWRNTSKSCRPTGAKKMTTKPGLVSVLMSWNIYFKNWKNKNKPTNIVSVNIIQRHVFNVIILSTYCVFTVDTVRQFERLAELVENRHKPIGERFLSNYLEQKGEQRGQVNTEYLVSQVWRNSRPERQNWCLNKKRKTNLKGVVISQTRGTQLQVWDFKK